ncbi:MAG: DUF3365 domain-containing protein, partial [Planctomycetota bacterium]
LSLGVKRANGFNMKHLFLTLLVTLVCVGCQKEAPLASKVDTVEDTIFDSPIPDVTKAKAVAAKDELFKQLSDRLMEVMKSEGPASAINVCSKEASQLATNVGEQLGVKIGRTALKLRNTNNAVPEWAENLASADAVDPQFVHIDAQTAGALLPIKLQQKCLICHGEQALLATDIKEQLAALYPADQATGFKDGDLRGWFWVEVPK